MTDLRNPTSEREAKEYTAKDRKRKKNERKERKKNRKRKGIEG